MTRCHYYAESNMTHRQLKAIIEASGKTRQQFADVIGVDIRTVYRWAAAEVKISPAFAALIRERIPEARKVLA